MATKESILDRIDAELAELEENTPFAKRDEAYFSELHIKTAFRNVLYNTPFSERIAGLLSEKESILHDMLEYWNRLDFEGLKLERSDFYEISYKYIEEVDYSDRNSQLYERAKAEYTGFIENLKRKTPKEIIEAAYEISTKEDILCLLETHSVDKKDINILLTLEKPLDSIYTEWLDKDCSQMDMLREAMDDLIDVQEHNLAYHQYHYKGQIPDIMRDYYEEYGESTEQEQGEAEGEAEQC